MQLTSLQLLTVNRILDLYNPQQQVICEFKSPTGSGKTLMASYFISALIEANPDTKLIFVIATPSSSDLPEAFERKINKYKQDLPFSKFDVEHIVSPSEKKSEYLPKIIPQRNKVYIFGKSSFGCGRILSEFGIIDDFIKSITDQGFTLVYIRDEAHIGTDNPGNDNLSQIFEQSMTRTAHFILKMTATPNLQDTTTKKVILTESELNDPELNDGKYLLKTTPVACINSDIEIDQILPNALDKFLEIKKQYAELNIGVRPALLIQVRNNAPSNHDEAEKFNANLAAIKKMLGNNTYNLKWAQYFGNNDTDSNHIIHRDFTLDDLTDPNSDFDVILFKIGPATGWDIPRACMLVQLRNVSSENLITQTLGRIKRNPYPNLERNDVTDKFYVYSNLEPVQGTPQQFDYHVRPAFQDETFLTIDLKNADEIKRAIVKTDISTEILDWLNTNRDTILRKVNKVFPNQHKTFNQVLQIVNHHQTYKEITNPFQFLRFYTQLTTANGYIYNKIQKPAEKFCTTNKVPKQFVITVLLTDFLGGITDLIASHRTIQPKFALVPTTYSPRDYTEMRSAVTPDNLLRIYKNNYLFGINEQSNTFPNYQPIDSFPERPVLEMLRDFAIENPGSIRVWAKNLRNSNIYGAYLDASFNIRKSYFDFIVKFENGWHLYIEVKSDQDINPEKTEMLEQAYRNYFTPQQPDLFTTKPKLIIALWHINTSTGYIDSKPFFDDTNSALRNLSLNKQTAMDFLGTISTLPE